MARTSIRDRNKAAIARDTETEEHQVSDTSSTSEAAPAVAGRHEDEHTKDTRDTRDTRDTKLGRDAASTPPSPQPRAGSRPARGSSTRGGTERLGVYFRPEEFEDAKGAYLADWDNHRGEADTFAGWIATALETHLARTPAERAANDRTVERAENGTIAGSKSNNRNFNIPADVVARVRAALPAERKQGRYLSLSAWCREAIALAVEAARAANGGTLPASPSRLPNKLTR